MDSEHFDRLAQSFGQPHSRRSLTRLIGGLGLGGVLSLWGTTETLAAKRNAGMRCTRNRQCKTGRCVGEPGQKVCSCSSRYACPAAAQCLHGGCFRSESCAAACVIGPTCGPDCYCSKTVSGVAVCFANTNFCGGGGACDADGDCPRGKTCVDVSCVGCSPVAAVCLGPCPVTAP
jgi:hypothetical protein